VNTPGRRPPRSRRTFWLLALLFLAPLVAAFWLYYGSGWRPAGRTNHGELIEPARPLPAAAGATFTGRWSLVYVGDGACDADCRATLYMIRQTEASLGRLGARVQQVFLVTGHCCDHEYLAHEHPALKIVDAGGAESAPLLAPFTPQRRERGIFIVDPLGNLMMRYDAALDPKGLREDLKRLLDLSHIG